MDYLRWWTATLINDDYNNDGGDGDDGDNDDDDDDDDYAIHDACYVAILHNDQLSPATRERNRDIVKHKK